MTVFVPFGSQLGRFLVLAILIASGQPLARAELSPKQKSVLASIAKGPMTGRWTELTTNQLGELRHRADTFLAECRKYHLPGGLLASVRFADTNRSQALAYEALDRSAAWTGLYLTALSFRYAVTRDAKNLADIRQSLDGVSQLLTATDRPGYVAKFVGRADDPAYRAYYTNHGGADTGRNGFGKWAYAGTQTQSSLVWLGNTSRDNYAGLNLGLATVYQMVRDMAIREKVATNVNRILDRLIEDKWRIDDGKGNVTFSTPFLTTALLRTGASVNPGKYQAFYEVRVKEGRDLQDMAAPGICRYCDYSQNLFSFATTLSLARLETNQTRRLMYQSKCTDLWRESGPHLNPWYAGAYASAFDSVLDPIVRATLQGQLYQFPDPPRWSTRRDNSKRKDLVLIEANGAIWSKVALPLAEQATAPFQWAHSPFALVGGADELVAHPGIDFLLPYWMGREGGMIPSEDDPPPITPQFKPAAPFRRATNATPRTSYPLKPRP